MVSTVYSRILKILIKRFKYVSRRIRDATIKVATIYIINKDDYVIDRFLGLSRPGTPTKSISNFAHFCAVQLDEDKRFVYSQALSRANWLKLQARGPGDKSIKHMCHSTHLGNLLNGLDEQLVDYTSLYRRILSFFVTERAFCCEEETHSLGSLEFSSIASEPQHSYDDSEDSWD